MHLMPHVVYFWLCHWCQYNLGFAVMWLKLQQTLAVPDGEDKWAIQPCHLLWVIYSEWPKFRFEPVC